MRSGRCDKGGSCLPGVRGTIPHSQTEMWWDVAADTHAHGCILFGATALECEAAAAAGSDSSGSTSRCPRVGWRPRPLGNRLQTASEAVPACNRCQRAVPAAHARPPYRWSLWHPPCEARSGFGVLIGAQTPRQKAPPLPGQATSRAISLTLAPWRPSSRSRCWRCWRVEPRGAPRT